MKKIIVTLLFAAILPIMASAQNYSIGLSEQEKEEITNRVKQKIDAFLQQLQYVASKDYEVSNEAVKTTLALFIGQGGAYKLDGTWHNGVKMQTATLRKNRHGRPIYNKPVLMTRYLKNLQGLPYKRVTIEQVGAVRVDNLRRVGENRYETMAYFCQYFRGERDGGYYSDNTWKSVKVYVERIDVGGGMTWQIYLGDMKVQNITK